MNLTGFLPVTVSVRELQEWHSDKLGRSRVFLNGGLSGGGGAAFVGLGRSASRRFREGEGIDAVFEWLPIGVSLPQLTTGAFLFRFGQGWVTVSVLKQNRR